MSRPAAPPQSPAAGRPPDGDAREELRAREGIRTGAGEATPTGRFDPLAETVRPTAADVAVTRRLSRPGAKRAEPKPADPPGYRLRELLGRGGFGAVWLATEAATGKLVAVKTFRHVRALDWPLLTREVEKLAALDASRHVVRLLAVGWEADPPYYVMEYLPDGSLADLLAGEAADGGRLPPARAAELAEGIAAGLVHAHGSGILHCDLKPGNVLLDRDGVPRLCDFGQARGVGGAGANGGGGAASGDSASETRTGARPLGTLFYMPPEQVAPDAAPDARWDVYALGAVLYEMLTGAPPHRTPEAADALRRCGPHERLDRYRRLVAESPPPTAHRDVRGVDPALVRIVDRCLTADPAERLPNAQAVRTALKQRSADAARRSRARWGLLGPAAVAVLLFVLGATLVGRTLDAGRGQIVERAAEANALSAGLVARSLEKEVGAKRAGLEAAAADPELPRLIADAAAADWARGPARAVLGRYLAAHTPPVTEPSENADAEAESYPAGGPARDTSWFLQDVTGVTRWRKPGDDGVVDENFVWRDYFHGLAKHLPRDTPPGRVPPVERTHVCLPYYSTTTAEWKLAISAPVRDAAGGVVAVLARTVVLEDLLAEYASTKRDITGGPDGARDVANGGADDGAGEARFDRLIALYDRQSGELLDHPWLAANPDASADQKRAVRLPPGERAELAAAFTAGRDSFRTAEHLDPTAAADGGAAFVGPWIAAFAPVRGTDWVVVVQEPRGAALRPTESVRVGLMRVGLASAAVVAAALGGLLYWFTRDRTAA